MAYHPRIVEKYSGTMEQLAKDMGNLRFDCLQTLVTYLKEDLKRQAEADTAGGRVDLGRVLTEGSQSLANLESILGKAWRISEPYMEKY